MHLTIKSLPLTLTVALGCGWSADLTDDQIATAVRRAVAHNGDEVFKVIAKRSVRITFSQCIYVLSASDRIAVAAYKAKQQQRPFSVKDARAIGLEMIAVVLEPSELSKRGVDYSYSVKLKADDKLVEPVCCIPESYHFLVNQASSTFMFSAIQGAQRLTVIVSGGDGSHREKKADPKLFEMR